MKMYRGLIRFARRAVAVALLADLLRSGGIIVLPFFFVGYLFRAMRNLYRRIERRLFPKRAEARAAEAALPSEPDWLEFGAGNRSPLSRTIRSQLRSNFPSRDSRDFADYSFESRKSHFPGAKQDLVIFDSQGKPTFQGRLTNERRFSFWAAPAVVTQDVETQLVEGTPSRPVPSEGSPA